MRRALGLVLGSALIVLLLRFLPGDVFAITQATLYLGAALVLLLVSGAMFLAPARRLLSALFALGLQVPQGALFSSVPEAEQRAVLKPLVVAGVCAAVAAVGGLVR